MCVHVRVLWAIASFCLLSLSLSLSLSVFTMSTPETPWTAGTKCIAKYNFIGSTLHVSREEEYLIIILIMFFADLFRTCLLEKTTF